MSYLEKFFNLPGEVWRSVHHPSMNQNVTQIAHWLLFVMFCVVLLRTLDQLVARRFKAPYFFLHTCINACIITFCLEDGYKVLSNPRSSGLCEDGICASQVGNAITTAAHAYHMLYFSMKRIDLIHHIPAMIVTTINCIFTFGPIINYTLLIMMGVPGGIDYFMLTLVKEGKMDKMKEKVYNERLNLWVRSPGCVISFYICFLCLWHGWRDLMYGVPLLGAMRPVLASLVGIHNLWNGQYFMRNTVITIVANSAKPIKVEEETSGATCQASCNGSSSKKAQ